MSENIKPPKEVTAEVFAEWRDARRGQRVAEDLSNIHEDMKGVEPKDRERTRTPIN